MKTTVQKQQSTDAGDETQNSAKNTMRVVIDKFTQHQEETALIYFAKAGSKKITFRELLRSVTTLAKGLTKSGLKNGECVLLFAPNSVDLIIGALATIYAGGVAVPVDLQASDEVLQHVLSDCDARRIFTDEKGQDRVRRLKTHKHFKYVRVDDESLENSWQNICEDKAELLEIEADSHAVMFYTSGTTGMPKGVPLSHDNLVFQVDSEMKTGLLQHGDRILLPLPLFHVYPFTIGLVGPLSLGMTVILPQSVTGPEVVRAMKEGKATVLIAVPRLLRALHDAIDSKAKAHKFSGTVFESSLAVSNSFFELSGKNIGKLLLKPVHKQFSPTLRLMACGGALLDPVLARRLRSIGWEVAVGYGLTETSPLLAVRMPNNRDLESVGHAIPGVQLRLTEVSTDEDDSKSEKQTEIQAKGRSVFHGYHNLPEKTKEVFSDDGWFRTGDLGIKEKGNFHVTGRISTMLKSQGGKKIQPDEVEEAYGGSPMIREIGVLQSKDQLVALVVPDLKVIGSDDVKKVIADHIHQMSSKLPSYERLNDFAITREPLPRTNLGKVKRQELIARYEKAAEAGKKGKAEAVEEFDYAKLSTSDQALLDQPVAKDCWEWLNERFPDQHLRLDMSPQIDLNIDSLEWMNLTLEMRERLGIDLTEDAIARVDTVRDLLEEVVDASSTGEEAKSPLQDPFAVLSDEQKKYLKPLSPFMSFLAFCLYWTNWIVMHTCFRMSVKGFDKLPDKQYVYTPNHESYLDALAVSAALPHKRIVHTQVAGWAGIGLANPLIAFIYRLAQSIPIEAKRSLISSLALGAGVLKNKNSLIWFPEGERTTTGKLITFKPGIGMILRENSVPVVPVFLKGTREGLGIGQFFPKFFQKIEVRFGEPVLPAKLLEEGEGDSDSVKIANAIKARVAELSKGK